MSRTAKLTVVVTVLSIIAFVAIYGVHILNPVYVDWLKTGLDVPQHYWGFVAYRNSDWTWPIGLMDRLSYPYAMSVIFTDSIPLFALIFKLLSPVLPGEFQYFGLWALLCFVLSGVISAMILKKYVASDVAVVAGSMFFVLAPVMIARIFMHIALGAQWLILLAFMGIAYRLELEKCGKLFFFWSAVGFLAASVHMYFVLMCGIVLCGSCLLDILYTRKCKRSIGLVGSYVVTSSAVVWAFGGFASGMDAGHVGLGIYSLNLNALINSMGWSYFGGSLATYTAGQYEGFAYPGLGIIVLVVIAVVALAVRKKMSSQIKKYWRELVAVGCVLFVALVVAASPVVTFGDRLLFQLPLPEIIEKLWSIFRASGRVVWIIVYAVMFFAICGVARCFSRKIACFVIVLMLALQIFDIHGILLGINEKFNQQIQYEPVLKGDLWDALAQNSNISHVVLLESGIDEAVMYSYGEWALENDKTLNRFYFARTMDEEINKNIADCLENSTEDTVFVFSSSNSGICGAYDLNYYRAGENIIGYVGEFAGFTKLNEEDLWPLKITFGHGKYISNGEDIGDRRYLNSGGFSHGPYYTLAPGRYEVEISGNNLAQASVAATYDKGAQICTMSDLKVTDSAITFVIDVNKIVDDLEILVVNNSNEVLELNKITIFPIN